MNNYLLQILKETKTIIIPGLGALTVTNEATGEIMFMSFLKHDDGNLAKYISEKEGMDINDAKNLIAKYVREIQAEVDKGEKYSMYQFGTFYKSDGEIAFEQWSAGSETSTPAQSPVEEKKPEVAAEQPVVEKAPEPIKTEEPKKEEIPTPVQPAVEEKKEPIVEKEEVPAPIPEIIVPPISEKEIKAEAPAPAVEPEKPKEDIAAKTETPAAEPEKVSVSPVIEEKIVVPPLEDVKSVEIPKQKTAEPAGKATVKSPKEQLKAADKQVKPVQKKKKTGVFAYILWGFVVLILGAGTYVAVQFDTLKKDFPILAELAGERVEPEKDTTLLSLGEKDPAANPDSMPEVESVPGEDIQAETEPVEPVEEVKPEPVKKVEPAAKPKPVEKPVAKPKPAPKPVVAKPTPQPKPKPVPTTTYSAPRPKPANFPAPNLSMPYHVIVGSFASKTNARNFATKLKGMGMSNLTIGEKDGLYKVSVNGYATEEEAKAALPSLKSIAPTAWVFNWK